PLLYFFIALSKTTSGAAILNLGYRRVNQLISFGCPSRFCEASGAAISAQAGRKRGTEKRRLFRKNFFLPLFFCQPGLASGTHAKS
ncbi:MAG: hypothetical protein ACREBD_02075, partial [Blastocatellia bacterium]